MLSECISNSFIHLLHQLFLFTQYVCQAISQSLKIPTIKNLLQLLDNLLYNQSENISVLQHGYETTFANLYVCNTNTSTTFVCFIEHRILII